MSILKKMLLILIILIVLTGVFWVGMSIYANFFRSPQGALSSMPDINEATYLVYIENTGNLLLANDYEHHGSFYILSSYWELVGQKWEYRDSQLVLDERVFGQIEIKRR